MRRYLSQSPEQTAALGRRLAECLRGGDVLALRGPLGAGKTCLVRGIAQGLGASPRAVSSPTFVICHLYEGTAYRLAHLDAYRLRGAEDLQSVGWQEMLTDARTIVAVEWPERIEAALPLVHVDVVMDHESPTSRSVVVTVPPTIGDRCEALDQVFDE